MLDFQKFFDKYKLDFTTEEIRREVKHIIDHHYENNDTIANRKTLFECLEITSLKSTDNEESISELVEKINKMDEKLAEVPKPAGICVYPSLVETVRSLLTEELSVSTVIGFPSSQTFTEVKIAETMLAVKAGATEIDMVMPVGKFLMGNYEEIYDEIQEIKAVCGDDAALKVIIEAGLLGNYQNVFKASALVLEAGADFAKSSTGKECVSDLYSVFAMCEAIKAISEDTGNPKGLKVAGGIKNAQDALMYMCVAKEVLQEDFINPDTFRIGASSLADNLAGEIVKKDICYFSE